MGLRMLRPKSGETSVSTGRLRAAYPRPDGTKVLRFEVPYEFSETEAALALAIVFRDVPMVTGINALNDGLRLAAQQEVLDDVDLVDAVSPAAVTAYRRRITSQPQIMFPPPKIRREMLKALREGQKEWRESDPETRPTAPTRLSRLWSKHERPDGTPVVRIEVPHHYDLDQSATALALAYPDTWPVARYEHKLRAGLQQVARAGLLKRAPEWSDDIPGQVWSVLATADRMVEDATRVDLVGPGAQQVPVGPSVRKLVEPIEHQVWVNPAGDETSGVWTVVCDGPAWQVYRHPYTAGRAEALNGLRAPDPMLVAGYRERLLDGIFTPPKAKKASRAKAKDGSKAAGKNSTS